jgi:hypothetical protein
LSTVVPGRGDSSVSTTSGSPLRWGTSMGCSSVAKKPASWAAAQFAWDRAAQASCSSRVTPYSTASSPAWTARGLPVIGQAITSWSFNVTSPSRAPTAAR